MVNHIETVTSLMNDMTVSGFKIIDIDTEESLDYLKIIYEYRRKKVMKILKMQLQKIFTIRR